MAQKEYTPFGEEWKKEMMRHTKKDLVQSLERICRENIEYQFEIRNLKKSLF